MNTPTACTCLLMCCLLNGQVVIAADNSIDPSVSTPALSPAVEATAGTSHVWIDAGAGCLGGAALGTVLPGIGNLIGCIAGGASVWWLRRTPTR